jgi:ABC-2 type transport system ATP-binding protein
MKSIINGGATTILVSHSINQVRSMCNKVLWLDHGNQIAFGNDVEKICAAYEKYLTTKVLPEEI